MAEDVVIAFLQKPGGSSSSATYGGRSRTTFAPTADDDELAWLVVNPV
jgi:hypothetical protein